MIEILAASVPVLAAIVTASVKYYEVTRGPARRIKTDQEILKGLHDGSSVRERLASTIDAEIEAMITDRRTKSRNWGNVALGLSLVAIGAGSLVLAFSRGGLWWVPTLPLGFLGTVGIWGTYDGLSKGERNERGNLASHEADPNQGSA